MRQPILLTALTLSWLSTTAIAQSGFDQLLEEIRQGSRAQITENRKRLDQFRQNKDRQSALLAQAEQTLQGLIEENTALEERLQSNEALLADEAERLRLKTGDLGELFGVIRQVAGEVKAGYESSFVSLQFPERSTTLDTIAQSEVLPQVAELEVLWLQMLQEIGESGLTRRFEAEVVGRDGTTTPSTVTRIGAFALLADNQYLKFTPGNYRAQQLQTELPALYRDPAQLVASDIVGYVPAALDPTRGQLLSLMEARPSLLERVRQGGVIGYVIIALGALGLLIAIIRYVHLSIVLARVKRQSRSLSNPKDSNPLGRVAKVYQRTRKADSNARNVALEEAMVRELPPLERFVGLVKLITSVAPLLGLLGTVVGMIITFQAITLFGTGDPKLMAGGISTALVTTALGLSVAVPLLFVHALLQARSRRIIDLIEQQGLGLLARSALDER